MPRPGPHRSPPATFEPAKASRRDVLEGAGIDVPTAKFTVCLLMTKMSHWEVQVCGLQLGSVHEA